MRQAILPRVIGALGAKDFAAVTARSLCELLGFDLTAVFLHRRRGLPVVVFHNFDALEARGGIENYVRFTHRINPMLARERPAGVCRARDFSLDPDGARDGDGVGARLVLTKDEELGFRTLGWPRRQEEICLYLEACAGVIELGFYRERGRSAVAAGKVRALASLSGSLAAAFDRHEVLSTYDRANVADGLGVAARPQIQEAPGRLATLSPREREIYDLLLLGCSSAAIALRLDISRHTVKDHRKHIFSKLQVGSLAELFARVARAH